MKVFAKISMVLGALLGISCTNIDLPLPDSGQNGHPQRVEFSNPRYKRVMLYYGEAYNNLAKDIDKNLAELESNYVPAKTDFEVMLCYVHKSRNSSDWATPTEPVLFRMYRLGNEVVRDTLVRYPAEEISVKPEMVRKVLNTVRQRFPSRSYGMVFSSHASGWIPSDYPVNSETGDIFGYSVSPTSIGAQYDNKRNEHTMDVQDFADALPFKLDYLLFDCCLMGGIETTYTLRDKADFIIASPTEVLSEGFNYKTLGARLLEEDTPNLIGVCEDYYNKQVGGYGATVGLYDCSQMEAIADVCAEIFSGYNNILSVDERSVQNYNYSFQYHYDFRDIIAQMGADKSELAKLDEALDKFVIYKRATERFIYTPIKAETFSGISMYLPRDYRPVLNKRYKETEWNIRTEFLK